MFEDVGLSWGIFGQREAILGSLMPSWGILGPILGPSWASLKPFWAYVGFLGAMYRRSDDCVGNICESSKTLFSLRTIHDFDVFWLSWGHLGTILEPSWAIFGPFLGPS
jgi:hypothetical protein